jgi:hypothetical protein
VVYPFFNDRRPHLGLDYPAYLRIMAERAAAGTADLTAEQAEKVEYTRLNLHRSQRIGHAWRPSPHLAELLDRIHDPQLWLVLTEPWCGDSAQCLPCLAVMAEGRPAVDLRLLLRDDNLDIMDEFLTDRKRSIPKLVAFDLAGKILFQWGPRPVAAQAVFDAATAEGLEKPQKAERLHLWYGRDRGRALDTEFVTLLTGFLDRAPA